MIGLASLSPSFSNHPPGVIGGGHGNLGSWEGGGSCKNPLLTRRRIKRELKSISIWIQLGIFDGELFGIFELESKMIALVCMTCVWKRNIYRMSVNYFMRSLVLSNGDIFLKYIFEPLHHITIKVSLFFLLKHYHIRSRKT